MQNSPVNVRQPLTIFSQTWSLFRNIFFLTLHLSPAIRILNESLINNNIVYSLSPLKYYRDKMPSDQNYSCGKWFRGSLKLLLKPSVILLQFLIEIARQKNRHPLPQIQAKSGLRLPPDRYCLTSTNYKVKAQKKVLLT